MFELAPESYIILNHEGKNKLALITSLGKNTVTAYLDDDLQKDDTVRPIKLPFENIVASLGKTPKVGSAYGVKVEPFLRAVDDPVWGTISYYRRVPKAEKDHLYKALDRTSKKLDKLGLMTFIPVDLQIRQHTGKHLGYYKSTKKEGAKSILCLQPPAFDLEPADIDYIIYHEAAHGIWYTAVPGKYKAKWIKHFEKRVKCKVIKQKELDVILNELYKYDGSIKDFIKDEAGDHEQDIIKEALKYMKKIFRLSVDEVDIMLQTEDGIDKYWPTQQDISKVFPDISLYSMKDVHEFWAEAVSHYLCKNELPSDVKDLIEETFDVIQNR